MSGIRVAIAVADEAIERVQEVLTSCRALGFRADSALTGVGIFTERMEAQNVGALLDVDFSSLCPIRQQLMSNWPCAPRFTSILVRRSTVRGGMRAAMTPVAAPATDEPPGRIERARRLVDPELSYPSDGRKPRCGTSP